MQCLSFLGGAFLWLVLLHFCTHIGAAGADTAAASSGTPHNNWAVLVCTSRFWFNYRHIANTLSMYRTVKRLGIPDSNIILMLADDVACNPRNSFSAKVINNADTRLDLYGDNVEVDYRGYDVTVENFVRLLTDRVNDNTPPSKRLMSDEHSNVFVYMTGHGGDEFLKFQDNEELGAQDLGDAFEQMWQKRRYKELLFMIDTCQANTMYKHIYSPNVIGVGSSKIGTSSYSHHADYRLGVAVIDRFTYYNLEMLEKLTPSSKATLEDLVRAYNNKPSLIHSEPGIRTDLFRRQLNETLITDFFGGVRPVQLTTTVSALANELPVLSTTKHTTDNNSSVTHTMSHSREQKHSEALMQKHATQTVVTGSNAAAWTKSAMLWGSIAVLILTMRDDNKKVQKK